MWAYSMFSELEFPSFARLDAENAQFWTENLIPHAKIIILTTGNVSIQRTDWFVEEIDFLTYTLRDE